MEYIKLGAICDVINGYAFKSKKYSTSGVRIIRITNVQKGYVEDASPVYYPLNTINELKKYILYSGDLLISLTGNVGRVAILDKKYLPAFLNQRVACIRPKSDKILKEYLFYMLNTNLFEVKSINSSKGIAQKNISTEWLKNYVVPLPSIEIQQHLISILKKLEKAVRNKKHELRALDKLVKARFVEMFGEFPYNEKGWNIGTIRDLVSDVRYGTSKKASENNDGKYPYLRMNNITYDGKLDLRDLKSIDIPEKDLEKYSVKKDDILFNRTNSRELVGKTCVYTIPETMILAGFIIRVRLNELANPLFVSTFLNTDYSKQLFKTICKNASGQSNINATELQKIKIYIPPLSLQNKFANFVQQVDKSKFENIVYLNKTLSSKILSQIGDVIRD